MRRSAFLAVLLITHVAPGIARGATISLATRGDQEGLAGDTVFAACTLSTSANASTQSTLSTAACPIGSAEAFGGVDSSGVLSFGAFTEVLTEPLVSTAWEVDASATFADTVIADGPAGQNGFVQFTFPISGTFFGNVFLSGYQWTCGSGTGSTSIEPVPNSVTCRYSTVFGSPTNVQFGLSVGVSSNSTTIQTADFLHTVTLTEILLLDTNLNPINGSIESTTGFEYVLPAQAPEPGSMVLLGIGLAGLFTRRCYRQR